METGQRPLRGTRGHPRVHVVGGRRGVARGPTPSRGVDRARRRPRSGSRAVVSPFIRHFTATTQIDVLSETSAKARSYYLFLTVHGLDHWGRYLDEFAPVDGRWLITHRREITDAAFEGGWGAGAGGDGDIDHLTRPAPVLTEGSLRSMAATVDPHRRPRPSTSRRCSTSRSPSSWRAPRRAVTPRTARASPSRPRCSSRSRCCVATSAATAPSPSRPRTWCRPTSSSTRSLAIARRGAELGCHEALFTLGEAPEARYPDAAAWLAGRGYASTVDYLVAAAAAVLAETGLLPHANAGALTEDELRAAPGGVAVAGDDDRDPRRPARRARRPARRRPRQDPEPDGSPRWRRRAGPGCRSPPASWSASARPADERLEALARHRTPPTSATATCRR